MTVKELELAQKDLQQRMLDRAKSLGYNPDDYGGKNETCNIK